MFSINYCAPDKCLEVAQQLESQLPAELACYVFPRYRAEVRKGRTRVRSTEWFGLLGGYIFVPCSVEFYSRHLRPMKTVGGAAYAACTAEELEPLRVRAEALDTLYQRKLEPRRARLELGRYGLGAKVRVDKGPLLGQLGVVVASCKASCMLTIELHVGLRVKVSPLLVTHAAL